MNKTIPEESIFMNESLKMTYSSEDVLGKTVKFTLNPDKTTAQVEISGSGFELNKEILPTSALFGVDKVLFDVKLEATGKGFVFNGNTEVNGFKVEYTGEIVENQMILDLKANTENSLVGTYNLNTSLPLTIVWNGVKGNEGVDKDGNVAVDVPIFTEPYALKNLIVMAVGVMPLVPDPTVVPEEGKEPVKVSVVDALTKVFDNVQFHADGNVTVTSKLNGKSTPMNIATYAYVKENTFKLFLNPFVINSNFPKSSATKAGEPEGLDVVLANLKNHLYSKLVDGITLTCGKAVDNDGNSTDALAICISEIELAPIFKIVKPLFENEAAREIIKTMIANMVPKEDPMAGMINMILPAIIDNIPAIIKNTTEVKIGINVIAK